jgi:hypothetical protein
MITVVVVPASIRQKRLSDIYFLGALLEKGTLSPGYKSVEDVSRRQASAGIEQPFVKSAAGSGLADKVMTADYMFKKAHNILGIDALIQTEKILPSMQAEKLDKQSIFFDFQIDGEAGKREALFKPLLSGDIKFLSPNQDDGSNGNYNIKLEISITNRGEVLVLNIVQTSGYPHIDLIVKEYIKKWIFRPLGHDSEHESTEGIMSVKLLL